VPRPQCAKQRRELHALLVVHVHPQYGRAGVAELPSDQHIAGSTRVVMAMLFDGLVNVLNSLMQPLGYHLTIFNTIRRDASTSTKEIWLP
jgi:hypothetical protein